MYKILSSLLLVASLNADVAGGIAIVVKGEPITMYDIKQEMQLSKLDAKGASEALIRRALENVEIKERFIDVSSSDVYDDIRKTATRNNMSVNDFYKAIQTSNGLSSYDLKTKIRQKLLSQKLYSAISYSAMQEPTQDEIQEYYELNKEMFMHPSAFSVTIYKSKDQMRLHEKITNPMLYAPDIQSNDQTLAYDRIAPELASLLNKTQINTFTQIIPDGQGSFMSFYMKEIHSAKETTLDGVKNQIVNKIMANKREAVLGEYFARLRQNADITVLREVE